MDKTPVIQTPGVFGRSMHVANSPGLMYSMGSRMKSPLFTPMRSYHNQEFTQEYQPDMSVMHSPGIGGQTPLPFNQISNTPLIAQSTSPLYGMAMSVNRIAGSSYIRSPHYNMASNMGATNSPNYSSSARSHSPDYNSPGSGRYGNSPSYGQTPPIDSNRPFKDEEDAEE